MSKQRILLVDDDPSLLRLLSIRLEAAGYIVDAVDSGEKALASFAAKQPRLVITDLRMGGMDGMALFDEIHGLHPSTPVVVLTAHGTIPDAVAATQRGVYGYLTKPYDGQALLAQVAGALKVAGPLTNPGKPGADNEWRSEIITRSPVMEELLSQARLVAESETSVLIQSDSGTGKELLARAIHNASPRRQGPFVPVNCTAIPEQLLESELFGHSKGSFTGATRSHKGLFQAAHGGTLFLDEIGDMPMSFQAKLLRVLQEGEVRPVGATETIPIDVRIVCATHRRLEEWVSEGLFREDLYYRLNVIMLQLPTLAERREDIKPLADAFLASLSRRSHKTVTGFAPEAIELLLAAPWPGNVRQLRNVVEQAVALATTPIIPARLVQKALREEPADIPKLATARDQFERDYLIRVLRISEGNVSRAARLAGRNRTEFYKLLQRHHLQPDLFRGTE